MMAIEVKKEKFKNNEYEFIYNYEGEDLKYVMINHIKTDICLGCRPIVLNEIGSLCDRDMKIKIKSDTEKLLISQLNDLSEKTTI